MNWTRVGDAADHLAGGVDRANARANVRPVVAAPPHVPLQHPLTRGTVRARGTIDALAGDAWRPAEAGGITR